VSEGRPLMNERAFFEVVLNKHSMTHTQRDPLFINQFSPLYLNALFWCKCRRNYLSPLE